MDVVDGRGLDGPIDRARYSPIAWLPGGEHYYYVRRLDAGSVPEGEEQYHRRVWLHEVGTDPDHRRPSVRRAMTATSYFGVSVSPRRPLAVSVRDRGHRAAQRLLVADSPTSSPHRPPLDQPDLRAVRQGVDASTGVVRRRGTGALRPHRPGRPARAAGVATSPEHAASEHWLDLCPRTTRRCSRTSRSSTAPSSSSPPVCWRRGPGTPSGRSALHDLADRRAARRAGLPRAGCRHRSAGSSSGPRAATRCGSATPTTPRPGPSALRRAHRRDHALGPAARVGRRAGRHGQQVEYSSRRRHRGATCS